jgi:hypothetical protein
VKTGNADRSDYAATVVYYTAGNQQKAQFLATQLFGGAQVQPVPAALNVTAGDAVVVLGKDYSPNAVAPKTPGSTNPLLPAGPPVVEPAAQPWFSAC